MSITAYFENKLANLATRAKETSRKINIVGTLRVIWFLSFLVVFVYLINIRQLDFAIVTFVIFVVGFGLLVILYNRFRFNHAQVKFLSLISEQEQSRLGNDLADLPGGNEYLDEKHVFAADLDVFGPNSIFQLLNRTSTIPGKELLAKRLKGDELPVPGLVYQETVKKMAENPDFIQEYQALGKHFAFNKEEYEGFNTWLRSDEDLAIVNRHSWLLLVLPAFILLAVIISTILSITYYTLLPIIIINLFLLVKNHARTSKVVEQTAAVVKLLKTYIRHIRLIKETEFSTTLALDLQGNLHDEKNDAEKDIANLSYLLDQLQARNNLLHIFVNVPLILDLQWMTRLNKWRHEHRALMTSWMTSLAEFEVLVSLSGTAFLNPDWCFPALVEEEYILDGKGFGHPLILAEKRVCNDFSMQGPGQAVIITGPNMAGKSTFLRTLALNVVLAQMGGPVCASTMTLSRNMQVFTAMRTQDNLGENISSFYAELDRIKQLLGEIESGTKVLYFLDELLKGTNSADRHRGAEALVRQLISLNVSGFVSTHDIELGELTQQLKQVSNYSFESIISEGQISFDYKIREGVCSSFNASELMRQMGIKV